MADKQKAEESVSTSVRLSPETRKAFEDIATAERRTLGNVLRNALEDYLKIREKKRSS
jgi:predicted transcriptional regulator